MLDDLPRHRVPRGREQHLRSDHGALPVTARNGYWTAGITQTIARSRFLSSCAPRGVCGSSRWPC
jgi:hypothetical protein